MFLIIKSTQILQMFTIVQSIELVYISPDKISIQDYYRFNIDLTMLNLSKKQLSSYYGSCFCITKALIICRSKIKMFGYDNNIQHIYGFVFINIRNSYIIIISCNTAENFSNLYDIQHVNGTV